MTPSSSSTGWLRRLRPRHRTRSALSIQRSAISMRPSVAVGQSSRCTRNGPVASPRTAAAVRRLRSLGFEHPVPRAEQGRRVVLDAPGSSGVGPADVQVAEHGGGVVAGPPPSEGVDIEHADHRAVGDDELGLVEVAVDGDAGLHRVAPDPLHQLGDPVRILGQEVAEEVAEPLHPLDRRAGGQTGGGPREGGEEAVERVDVGERRVRLVEGVAHAGPGQRLESEQAEVAVEAETARNRQVGGESPVVVVQCFDLISRHQLQEEARRPSPNLDHRPRSGPVGAEARLDLAPGASELFDQRRGPDGVEGGGEPGDPRIVGHAPHPDPGAFGVRHQRPLGDALAGHGDQVMGAAQVRALQPGPV